MVLWLRKSTKSSAHKEVNHPRVLGQHSLRLPPLYMDDNQDLYKKIFQALAVIESKYAKEKDKVSIEISQQLIANYLARER